MSRNPIARNMHKANKPKVIPAKRKDDEDEDLSVADEMEAGDRCQQCGQYLHESVGHFATCTDCGGTEKPI